MEWRTTWQVDDRWQLFPLCPPNRVEFNNGEKHQILIASTAISDPGAESSPTKILADALFVQQGDSAVCTLMSEAWPSLSVVVINIG